MAKSVLMLKDEERVWAAVFGASFARGFPEETGPATEAEVIAEAVATADAAVRALRIYRRDVEPSAGVCTEAIDE
jgi:hypothetical protein